LRTNKINHASGVGGGWRIRKGWLAKLVYLAKTGIYQTDRRGSGAWGNRHVFGHPLGKQAHGLAIWLASDSEGQSRNS